MPESLNYPEDQRHALTTDERCVMLAQAVGYYADQIQHMIANNWELLCEAVADIASSAKQQDDSDRADVRQPIERLSEARVLSQRLAKLPVALGAVSPFSQVVNSFWLSVYDRLKRALKSIGPRPKNISDAQRNEFRGISSEFSSICEIATLVIQAGGFAYCKFELDHKEFLANYSPRSPDTEVVKLSDPWLNDKYVDINGIVEIFRWFGRTIKKEGVKQYLRTDLPKRPHDATSFPEPEATYGGHDKHLYSIRSVVLWFETNEDKLELSLRTDLPKKDVRYFCKSDKSVIRRPPPPKPR